MWTREIDYNNYARKNEWYKYQKIFRTFKLFVIHIFGWIVRYIHSYTQSY